MADAPLSASSPSDELQATTGTRARMQGTRRSERSEFVRIDMVASGQTQV
jgi:hypothetical protein